ncbi:oxygen-insensitive NAD(P)H nitroreductase [Phocoenobacter skyensis]|uniref:Nitroreductase / dihydropteridine reductase n=1 Tax=Phocoenobacter skyensis TaxID=97481 RepID=A0A1H7VTL8_9PAST|nr:oxygen-insensitive NAD(P)H nitroreductase [Pasteurella skyensis]MDP8078910.1 oxygen-insensitive NAD(P)H nitroreductase [Pasteurella skyensis]MDP8084777.1 oxygen-insensitive NAD(P)H nitroreductase [Pasteurella skyensis]MDP8184883.1 oxygen-insensitive NAD(P)H nitroreductase [Pasteurella skyensis]QLB22550.1 NAD(P)H nitroreductase [Pasteurella skyensis]SEM12165.1 nitroreductase / dihydropteridine reductase [Pasteurella skyensis]
MSILETAKKRYSTKSFNPNKKISDADIHTLKTIYQLSPSSINIQPWHTLITDSEERKKQITQATQGNYIFNEQKILDASHIMVLCVRNDIDQNHLDKLLEKEQADGRIPNEEIYNMTRDLRNGFLASHSGSPEFLQNWAANQIYIALGGLLLAAADMVIDTLTMEGFDPEILSAVLGLKEKGLTPVTLVALGYHNDDDFNANLPKSRFELDEIFTHF